MHMHNEPENKLFQQNILLVLFSIFISFCVQQGAEY